jgi:hypothetical protein
MNFKEFLNENYVKASPDVVSQLESFMTEWFDDNIEILSPEFKQSGDEFEASIGYDGSNNKNNRGVCTFKYQVRGNSKVEDFDVTGSNYKRPFSPKLTKALN